MVNTGIFDSDTQLTALGVVVIGRNEGERLKRCLLSLLPQVKIIVYVDSGSTDNSLELAKELGVIALPLDLSIPFTAARARNTGYRHLIALHPELKYVQFVDGDCEVDAGWMPKAFAFLEQNPRSAVVCGRRRERFPNQTIYNKLCDWEWDGPAGEAKACGGDALMRLSALVEVAGYRDDFIAGEEPELCVRLRKAGWQVWRLAAEMTLHDAAMTKFSQWWKRTARGGYAFAAGCYQHGFSAAKHSLHESQRIWLWGFIIPVLILAGALLLTPLSLLALLIYPVQIIRLARGTFSQTSDAWLLASFMVLCKFPELVGQLKFISNRVMRKTARLIEYK